MLLVIDVGNTNTVLGLYKLDKGESNSPPLAHWRIATIKTHTTDEYGVLFRNLFAAKEIQPKNVRAVIISSVVPPLDFTFRQVCERYFKTNPLFVEPGVKTGMALKIDNPYEVGADRIVNAVAAYEKYGGPCVIVDFGTATTFDVVSAKGEYLGGAISPGIGISAEALVEHTARLLRVDIRQPKQVIGKNTVECLQSGLFYGYLGLIDEILRRTLDEVGSQARVVATGGFAPLLAASSKYISAVDDLLTLEGLRLIWQRNQSSRPRESKELVAAPSKS